MNTLTDDKKSDLIKHIKFHHVDGFNLSWKLTRDGILSKHSLSDPTGSDVVLIGINASFVPIYNKNKQ